MKGRLPHIILRFSKPVAQQPAAPPTPASRADTQSPPPPEKEDPILGFSPGPKDRTPSAAMMATTTATANPLHTVTTAAAFAPSPPPKKTFTPRTSRSTARYKNPDVVAQSGTASSTTTASASRKKTAGETSASNHNPTTRANRRITHGGNRSLSPDAYVGHSPVTPVSTGKRKRDIPKSIGGGKGDLQPPSKRNVRTSPAAEQTNEKKEEKRVLRSQDTIKKSEYEEWFENPKDEFDVHMKIRIIRDFEPRTSDEATQPNPRLMKAQSKATAPKEGSEINRIRTAPVQKINLEEELLKSAGAKVILRLTADPLADDAYIPTHRGEERREKRIRNIEREVLAHNIEKIEKDLEKIHSPEWIKSIGLSPAVVAATSKKELDARRQRLIDHLEAIVEKHKSYKDTERRKKTGRTTVTPPPGQSQDRISSTTTTATAPSVHDSARSFTNEDDDDSTSQHRASGKKPRRISNGPSKPPPEEREFTSFYDKPYLRQQALSGWRKSSRTQTAFGQPLPTLVEKEYELPSYITARSGNI